MLQHDRCQQPRCMAGAAGHASLPVQHRSCSMGCVMAVWLGSGMWGEHMYGGGQSLMQLGGVMQRMHALQRAQTHQQRLAWWQQLAACCQKAPRLQQQRQHIR